MTSRLRFWLKALENGAASLNSAAGWFASAVLVLGVAAGVVVPVVTHVSHWLTAVIILGIILIAALEGSYRLWAATDRERIAALDSARQRPSEVTPSHGDRLRLGVHWLRDSLEGGRPLFYGGEEDADMWRRALIQHFPGLQVVQDRALAKDTAIVALKDRLHAEAAAAAMDMPPWTAKEFLPWLTRTIAARARKNILGSDYNFRWNPWESGALDIGTPMFGLRPDSTQVLQDSGQDADDLRKRMEEFEAFFRKAESSPEAAAVRQAWDELAEMGIQQLAAAENTDPITSRCFLCDGSNQRTVS